MSFFENTRKPVGFGGYFQRMTYHTSDFTHSA